MEFRCPGALSPPPLGATGPLLGVGILEPISEEELRALLDPVKEEAKAYILLFVVKHVVMIDKTTLPLFMYNVKMTPHF